MGTLKEQIAALNDEMEILLIENREIKKENKILHEKYELMSSQIKPIDRCPSFDATLDMNHDDTSLLLRITKEYLKKNKHPIFVSDSTPILQFIIDVYTQHNINNHKMMSIAEFMAKSDYLL